MQNNHLIEEAIKYFSKLPGFGPRSAKKTLLFFLKNKDLIEKFTHNLIELQNTIQLCEICHNICTSNICDICTSHTRNKKQLCVVCEVDDIWNIEKSTIFKGVYHCLGGNLSAISGITPEKLTIQSLLNRIIDEKFEEIIFANNLSIEGATTVFYIIDEIEKLQNQGKINNIKITELANGIPLGGNLEYMDEGTIEVAFKARRGINS
jgi:recombination protein RecR